MSTLLTRLCVLVNFSLVCPLGLAQDRIFFQGFERLEAQDLYGSWSTSIVSREIRWEFHPDGTLTETVIQFDPGSTSSAKPGQTANNRRWQVENGDLVVDAGADDEEAFFIDGVYNERFQASGPSYWLTAATFERTAEVNNQPIGNFLLGLWQNAFPRGDLLFTSDARYRFRQFNFSTKVMEVRAEGRWSLSPDGLTLDPDGAEPATVYEFEAYSSSRMSTNLTGTTGGLRAGWTRTLAHSNDISTVVGQYISNEDSTLVVNPDGSGVAYIDAVAYPVTISLADDAFDRIVVSGDFAADGSTIDLDYAITYRGLDAQGNFSGIYLADLLYRQARYALPESDPRSGGLWVSTSQQLNAATEEFWLPDNRIFVRNFTFREGTLISVTNLGYTISGNTLTINDINGCGQPIAKSFRQVSNQYSDGTTTYIQVPAASRYVAKGRAEFDRRQAQIEAEWRRRLSRGQARPSSPDAPATVPPGVTDPQPTAVFPNAQVLLGQNPEQIIGYQSLQTAVEYICNGERRFNKTSLSLIPTGRYYYRFENYASPLCPQVTDVWGPYSIQGDELTLSDLKATLYDGGRGVNLNGVCMENFTNTQ